MLANRRQMLALSAAAGGLAMAPRAAAIAAAKGDPIADMIVIDTLGGLIDPNVPGAGNGDGATPPIMTPRIIRDVRRSGLTAVNITIGYVLGDRDPFELSVREVARWNAILRENSKDLVKIWTAGDIRAAKANGKIGAIYGFQNGEMLGTDPSRVDLFADMGLRVQQLTYNGKNALGCGALVSEDTGLTPVGRAVVERLNARAIVVDLAHSGRRTCLDAIAASRAPIAVTHTGCAALYDHPRNKTDEELRKIGERGGYVGIYCMPFLAAGRNSTGDDVINHVEHAMKVCGEDNVGIGTDCGVVPIDDMAGYLRSIAAYVRDRRARGISSPGERDDTVPFASDMNGIDLFRSIAERMSRRGHPRERIAKVLGLNFLRYAGLVWRPPTAQVNG